MVSQLNVTFCLQAVEFKRKIDQELCLKDVISRSITVEVDVVHGANGPAELPEQQWTQDKVEQHAGALEPQGSAAVEADVHHGDSETVDPNNDQPGPSNPADVGEHQEVPAVLAKDRPLLISTGLRQKLTQALTFVQAENVPSLIDIFQVSHDEGPVAYATATKSELDSGNVEISQEFLAQLGLQLSTKEAGANSQVIKEVT